MEPRREVTPSQSLPSSACWMEAGGAAQLGGLACAPSTSGISRVCRDPPPPPGKTRQIQTDKANKWQLHMLIMLIKRRAELRRRLTTNKDLSVNEEDKMMMDRDEASSDRSSPPMLARTFRRQRQHVTPPLGVVSIHDSAEIYGC